MPTVGDEIWQRCTTLTTACTLYSNQWIGDESLFRIFKTHYPECRDKKYTRKALNTVLTKHAAYNNTNIHRAEFQIECPFEKKKRNVKYYYFRVGDDAPIPNEPSSASDIVDVHTTSVSLQNNRMRPAAEVQATLNSLRRAQQQRQAASSNRRTSPRRRSRNTTTANEVTPPRQDNESTTTADNSNNNSNII